MSTSDASASSSPRGRLGRRQILTVAGAAAAFALVPALVSSAGAAANPELLGTQAGTLAGNSGGSFNYYQVSQPTGATVTITLSYAPFDVVWAHAIGVKVYQKGNTIASMSGQSFVQGDTANNSSPSVTMTPSASGGPVLLQVFNYSPTTISYTLTSSLSTAATSTSTTAPMRYVYVGTYTESGTKPTGSVGIYVYKMTGSDGNLGLVQSVATQDPSWVTIDPSLSHLYSTNELGMVNGKPGGMVTAFAINGSNGTLTMLNQQLTLGTYPAHISVHPSGKWLLGTNYGTGNFPIYPIQSDGSLGPMSDNYQDTGSGPNRDRQEGPHAHQIQTDPNAQYVFGNDLGTDRVNVWTLNQATGKLSPNQPLSYVQVAGGSGPRHTAFHPSSKWMYVISEMASSITAFSYDAAHGLAIWIQTVSTLPSDFTGSSSCSEIAVHPNGKFVYGANRGHDSIAIFAIDPSSGKLSSVGWQSTQGNIPRNFAIDPSGALLYAANQNSNNIVVFAIDGNTGKLTPTGRVISTPSPVCVAFGRTV